MLQRARLPQSLKSALAPSVSKSKDSLGLADFLAFAKRYKGTIGAAAVACALLGAAYALTTEPLFTSRAYLLISVNTPEPFAHDPQRSGMDIAEVESQVETVKSARVANAVVEKLNLSRDPTFVAPKENLLSSAVGAVLSVFGHVWDFFEGLILNDISRGDTQDDSTARYDYAVALLRQNLDVRRVGASYVIEISFSWPDRHKAAQITNAIAEAYMNDQLQARQDAIQGASDWLQDRLNELREKQNDAARAVEAFKGETSALSAGAQALLREQQAAPSASLAPDRSKATEDRARADRIQEITARGNTLRDLESQAQAYRSIYDSYLKRYTEIVQQQSFSARSARLLTDAEPSSSPSHPRKKLIIALATVFGGCLGVAIALVRQGLDRKVWTPEQISALGVDCLGYIPVLDEKEDVTLPVALKTEAMPSLISEFDRNERLRYVKSDPTSRFAEGVRNLKASLDVLNLDRSMRCVGLCSAERGAGKTLVASNLAHLYALSGVRTLLIDSDLRNPTLSKAVNYSVGRGWLSLLDDVDLVSRVAVRDRDTGLYTLPAPTSANNFCDILGSERMHKMLSALRERFEHIIVDLPVGPIGDARIIAPALDGVVLLVAWGETQVDSLQMCISSFSFDPDKVVGTVLNKADLNAMRSWGQNVDPDMYNYY